MYSSRNFRLASLFAVLAVTLSMVTVDQAEARRGGSFGSRGMRTYQTAPTTTTAPAPTAPMQRSMTPSTQQNTAAPQARPATQPRQSTGFGGAIMRGLFFGGILGLLFGSGFGGFAGVFGFLFQALLIVGAIALLMRFMRSRSAPAVAGAGGHRMSYESYSGARAPRSSGAAGLGGGSRPARRNRRDEVGISGSDLDRFEAMLGEVQDAYSREDYDALRRLTTPEMMSYLAEELAENAAKGLRNQVSDVRLLQGDLAEAWSEGASDYATTAMRYQSRDFTQDRTSAEVVLGDADRPTEATEHWTFVRENRGPWKLSAIQEA